MACICWSETIWPVLYGYVSIFITNFVHPCAIIKFVSGIPMVGPGHSSCDSLVNSVAEAGQWGDDDWDNCEVRGHTDRQTDRQTDGQTGEYAQT